ncbi:MAG: GNAT family N-acetyltransferase, partial [Pseudomonadales bacterium]|nr:GNAT family N-acetyltransferase [Pseudomonadales bacterium]
VRPARAADVDRVRGIEAAAATRFADTGHPELASGSDQELIPLAQLSAAVDAGQLLVAELDGVVVGFALLGTLAGDAGPGAHLRELDVLPDAGRRGVGTALIEAACAWGASQGAARIVLTTFRDVVFNAPLYARRGFIELSPEARGPVLDALLAAETDAGFSPSVRCAMARPLSRSPT